MSEEQPTESPQPSDGQVQEKLGQDIQAEYQKTVKDEHDKQVKEESKKMSDQFHDMKGMGFVTDKDLGTVVDPVKAEVAKIRAEWTELRAFLLRKKAQGDATIPPDGDKKDKQSKEIVGAFGKDLAKQMGFE